MNQSAFLLDLVLSLVEFIVINRALRVWLDHKGLLIWLAAAVLSAVPVVGGIAALAGAIAILEWRWWIAAGLFVGGTAALVWIGGIGSLIGQGLLF